MVKYSFHPHFYQLFRWLRYFYAFSLVLLSNHPSILLCPNSHTLSEFSLMSSPSFSLFLLHMKSWFSSQRMHSQPPHCYLDHYLKCFFLWIRFFHSICNLFVQLVLISHHWTLNSNVPSPDTFPFLFLFQFSLPWAPSPYFSTGTPFLYHKFSVLYFSFCHNNFSPVLHFLSLFHPQPTDFQSVLHAPFRQAPQCSLSSSHLSFPSSCPVFCP